LSPPVVFRGKERPMRQVVVRYRVKKERVAEHEKLIGDVFEELRATDTKGIRYGAFRLPDGVSFMHVALIEGSQNPLDGIAAFKAFTKGIEERCDELPQAVALTPVGLYGL
jgi:hypothetical protein